MAATQRYKLTIAYRGTAYHGWQTQAMTENYRASRPGLPEGHGIPTVQETVSRAVEAVVRHPVTLIGSSRTDAGVHAKGQLAHFDTDRLQIPPLGLMQAVNARLPEDILVRAIEAVPETYDAIGSTASKRYQYLIWNAEERPTLFPDLAWHRWQTLDVAAMARAAGHLVGTHDFASFAKPGHEKLSTVRTVLACDVARRGARVVVGVEGTGFLWNMVRIIVGTLAEVGMGRVTADEVPGMLAARNRQAAGPTAPAHGLYLQWIKVGERRSDELPAVEAGAGDFFVRAHAKTDVSAMVEVARADAGRFDEERVGRLGRDLPFQPGYLAVRGREILGFLTFNVRDGVATVEHAAVRAGAAREQVVGRLVAQLRRDLQRHQVGDIQNAPDVVGWNGEHAD